MLETELFAPIKSYLESQGYVVKGEVKSIDVFAMKGETSIAVELKTTISLKLIYQAIDRQKIADAVYIAFPKTAVKRHQSSFRSLVLLCKRLTLGMMSVDKTKVEILLEAKPYDLNISKKRNIKKKTTILKEYSNRETNVNLGGTKDKIMTVYKEKALKIANCLKNKAVQSPRQIKIITGVEETASILLKNYYGWFSKIQRGQYALSEKGHIALRSFEGMV
ncbi:MAG: hypothetical protein IH571_04690 [Acholeplasmataceae bacterium]|nr:hypothetical protein [Acholeplasmataceae bacterium]